MRPQDFPLLKPADFNMKHPNKKFKNLSYSSAHLFRRNKLLLRGEGANQDKTRKAIFEVINSTNGKLISKKSDFD